MLWVTKLIFVFSSKPYFGHNINYGHIHRQEFCNYERSQGLYASYNPYLGGRNIQFLSWQNCRFHGAPFLKLCWDFAQLPTRNLRILLRSKCAEIRKNDISAPLNQWILNSFSEKIPSWHQNTDRKCIRKCYFWHILCPILVKVKVIVCPCLAREAYLGGGRYPLKLFS